MAKMIPFHSASSHAEIERRARELYERSGSPGGRDLDHWLQAEADHLEALHAAQANQTAGDAPSMTWT